MCVCSKHDDFLTETSSNAMIEPMAMECYGGSPIVPGGPTTIVAWAGKDASKFFNDIHKGVKIDSYLRPEAKVEHG